LFLQLNEAYAVLRDPVKRANYDASYQRTERAQWRLFDQSQAIVGAAAEKRKRQGILGLLYAKTLRDPEHGSINIFEFEQTLGCPREHLQTAMWYLKGKGYIQRADNGRYNITIAGFSAVEEDSPLPIEQLKLAESTVNSR